MEQPAVHILDIESYAFDLPQLCDDMAIAILNEQGFDVSDDHIEVIVVAVIVSLL